MDRLQKIIAEAGITSRRKAEELILAGRVKVNGQVITELGFKAGPKDLIAVDDKVIAKEEKKYYCIYKPRNVITSVSDEFDRQTVIDILSDELKSYRLYPVGRLDYDTKGVLLLTNDGDFMNQMVGPQSGIEKEYLVRVEGLIDQRTVSKLEEGVMIEGTKTLPSIVDVRSFDKKNRSSLVDIIITEGRNHQVKNMFEAVGFPVKHLTRIRFGCIGLDELAEGDVRPLTIHEIKTLKELAKKEKILKREKLSKMRRY